MNETVSQPNLKEISSRNEAIVLYPAKHEKAGKTWEEMVVTFNSNWDTSPSAWEGEVPALFKQDAGLITIQGPHFQQIISDWDKMFLWMMLPGRPKKINSRSYVYAISGDIPTSLDERYQSGSGSEVFNTLQEKLSSIGIVEGSYEVALSLLLAGAGISALKKTKVSRRISKTCVWWCFLSYSLCILWADRISIFGFHECGAKFT